MSRAARILLAAAAMAIAAAAPAAAQSARATVTASATVVEPLAFAAGPSTVAAARGAIDVTTPVAVRGRAAHVVQVVRASDAQPPVRAAVHLRERSAAPDAPTVSAYDVRLHLAAQTAAGGPATITYVVSTVN
jgi:hypothetical protein